MESIYAKYLSMGVKVPSCPDIRAHPGPELCLRTPHPCALLNREQRGPEEI